MAKTLRGKFLFAYITLITITIIVLSIMFGRISINSSMETTIDYSFEMAELNANLISQKLDNHISVLSLIANSDEGKALDINYIVSHINDLRNSDSYIFKNIAYITNDMTIITDETTLATSYDIKSSFTKKSTKYSKKFLITGPLTLTASKETVIALTVPIYSDKNILSGFLTGTITMKDMSNEFLNAFDEDDLFGVISDQRGFVIAHPEYDYYDQLNLKNLESIGVDDFDQFANEIITLPKGFGQFYNSIDDEHNIYIYVSIPKTPNWKLGIVAVQEDLMESSYILLNKMAIVGLLILIITIIVTTQLTRRVTKPVITVTQAVRESRLISIKDTSYLESSEELSTFVSSYNKMLVSLKRHTDDLEELVKERTTELNRANEKLHSLATTDSLTKIINRNQIYEELFSLKKVSDENPPKPFSILFIDLNNFKYYNDTFGHDIGDNLLVETTKILKSLIRKDDKIGRYGGDEFVIILPNTCQEAALELSTILIAKIDKLKGFKNILQQWMGIDDILIPESKRIGLSIGYACYDNDYNNIDQLIKDADSRMYQMKKAYKKK